MKILGRCFRRCGCRQNIDCNGAGPQAYWEGKSVLYLCYNHNIAQYVQYQFEKDRVYIEAVTLHAFMMRTCGVEWSPDLSQHFYEKELPATFMAAEDVPAYDLVIIDEGQDLLTDTYLECVDRIVRDGLGNGTWAIYYDPNQNIFNSYAQLDAMIMKLRKEAYAMSWKYMRIAEIPSKLQMPIF